VRDGVDDQSVDAADKDRGGSGPEALSNGPEEQTCQDCGARLHGPYCAQCGQHASDLHLTVGHFLHDALDGFFSFDSRVWTTVALLLRRPGFLTVEYWRGRRTRYLAPLRVYLFVSFLAFLVQGVLPSEPPDDLDADVSEVSAQVADDEIDWDQDFADAAPVLRWMALNLLRPAVEQPERMRAIYFQRLPAVVFLLVPFFAALLRVLYRKSDSYFVPHLVFALHFHSAGFVLFTVGALGDYVTGRDFPGDWAALGMGVLLFLSLCRAYGNSRLRTAWKETVLMSLHLLTAAVALTLLFFVTGLLM
jgi:hypothetical protein